jgi:hypothetical protein
MMSKISKTRKLNANREIRKLTNALDACVNYPARYDTVDLIHNLNLLDEFVSEYRKILVTEAKTDETVAYDGNTTARRYKVYDHNQARAALRQVGAALQSAFNNPAFRDKFFDNGKTFEGDIAKPLELGS